MRQFRQNRSNFYCKKYERKLKWLFGKVNKVYCSDKGYENKVSEDRVDNLTDLKLNDRELDILGKGPNFVPFYSKNIVFDTISSIESSNLSDEQKVGIQLILNKSLKRKEKFVINPAEIKHLKIRLIANDVIISVKTKLEVCYYERR